MTRNVESVANAGRRDVSYRSVHYGESALGISNMH